MYEYPEYIPNEKGINRKMNSIRLWLINQCCFCIWLTDGLEQKTISKSEISASEYIRYKKWGLTDYQIYDKTGYHY